MEILKQKEEGRNMPDVVLNGKTYNDVEEVLLPDGNGVYVAYSSGGGSSEDGEDGGYYTPKVSQPSASTMKVSFTPSKADMPSVAAVNVTLPAGADGKTPAKGVDYFDGNDGITPHIGNNGNWFIGDTDTGKPSRGEDGEDGSDANVTAENIETALGYKPANADDMVAGVHVGTEPPADPNVKVWIDTDDDPDDSGGGGASAQADWNAAEGEPGHILNRTHWSEWAEVIPEQTVPGDEELLGYAVESSLVLVAGETYRVKFDGVVYDCTAWRVEEEGMPLVCLGNKMLPGIGDDTGEPFVVMATDGFVQFLVEELKPEVTLGISVMQHHKIPAQYLHGGVHWIDAVEVDGVLTQITVTPAQTAEAIRFGLDVKLRITSVETNPNTGDVLTLVTVIPCTGTLAQNETLATVYFVGPTGLAGTTRRVGLQIDGDVNNPWIVMSD